MQVPPKPGPSLDRWKSRVRQSVALCPRDVAPVQLAEHGPHTPPRRRAPADTATALLGESVCGIA
ncbi:hypothetical protein M3669_13285, partial [Staphylococcus capitis]|nr:hypothetical protein [Staphylococcus capitis]